MKLVYIAGKYTDEYSYQVKQNIQIAEALGMKVVKTFGTTGPGVMVLIPHTNTAGWEGIQSDEWFYKGTEELLKRCDACIYVPGDRERSSGTKNEIQYCIDHNIPYFEGDSAGFGRFLEWLHI